MRVLGGPAKLAIDPEHRFLYIVCNPGFNRPIRTEGDSELSGYQIDWKTGGLKLINTISLQFAPAYLAMDRKGRFLLSAYYSSGKVSVHPVNNIGEIGEAVQWLDTGGGAHCIQTDPSNRFAFVPHIAMSYANKDHWIHATSAKYILAHGSNAILQFFFDDIKGNLTLNSPEKVVAEKGAGPRHFCFHPKIDVLYFSNEQGSSVTAYRFNSLMGTLSDFQTVSTLPEGYKGQNACSSIRISHSGRFVYVPNRGHDSIACFSTDTVTGQLTLIETVPTEAHPFELSLDPEGKFLFVVGRDSGRMAAYRVIEDNGKLQPLQTYAVGKKPLDVLITKSAHNISEVHFGHSKTPN
jgi:6-phosphogluconolactonase (cycloisomerase 2 family)